MQERDVVFQKVVGILPPLIRAHLNEPSPGAGWMFKGFLGCLRHFGVFKALWDPSHLECCSVRRDFSH